MEMVIVLVIMTIVVALDFEYSNGLHGSSNIIVTFIALAPY